MAQLVELDAFFDFSRKILFAARSLRVQIVDHSFEDPGSFLEAAHCEKGPCQQRTVGHGKCSADVDNLFQIIDGRGQPQFLILGEIRRLGGIETPVLLMLVAPNVVLPRGVEGQVPVSIALTGRLFEERWEILEYRPRGTWIRAPGQQYQMRVGATREQLRTEETIVSVASDRTDKIARRADRS